MEPNKNILHRLLEDYKGLSIGGIALLIVGQLIIARVQDWLNSLFDNAINWMSSVFASSQISLVDVVGWVITLFGIGLLFLAFKRAQNDVNRDVEEWKTKNIKSVTKGLQVVRLYHQYYDGGKKKALYLILRNDEDVTLSLSGYLSPVVFRGWLDTSWGKTKLDHGAPLMSHVDSKIDPKKTYVFRFAVADVEKDGFWIDCSINNPYIFDKAGFYKYRTVFTGESPNKDKYETEVIGYLRFFGGMDLEFIENLPTGIED